MHDRVHHHGPASFCLVESTPRPLTNIFMSSKKRYDLDQNQWLVESTLGRISVEDRSMIRYCKCCKFHEIDGHQCIMIGGACPKS